MLDIAVIGLGIGRRHLREYTARSDVRIAAVVDRDPVLAATVGAECGAPSFPDLNEMLAAVPIDAASVCTPPAAHVTQVEALAAAGAHILLEKPMAPTIADCRRIVAAARGAGVCLMVGQKKRFSPLYAQLKERFSGDLGGPMWASVKYALGRVDKPWFWDEEDGGGPIVENAIHIWDLLRYLMGEVESVVARGGSLFRSDHGEQVDAAGALLTFSNGALATVACGYGSEWGFADERLSFATPTAVCEVSGPFDRADRLRIMARSGAGQVQELAFENPDGFAEEIAAFVGSIRDGCDPPVTGEDALRSIAVALAVKRSIREGRPVCPGEISG